MPPPPSSPRLDVTRLLTHKGSHAAQAFTVPHAPRPLRGRQEELERLLKLMGEGPRLLTLTGAPGVGKTRLAIAAVEAEPPDRPCIWVNLAVDENPDHTLSTAYDIIAADHCHADAPFTTVLDGLDWLEVAQREDLALRWAQMPGCQVLITSQQRLSVPGAVSLNIGPVATQPSAPSHAALLLMDRVAERGMNRTLAGWDATSLEALVDTVDGVPLAIESLAYALDVTTPEQLLTRLRCEVGIAPTRLPVPSWRVVDDAITAAWRRLTRPQQHALQQASLFPGGFTLEEVEPMLANQSVDPMTVVSDLQDRGLVSRHADASGEARMRVLAPIRRHALSRASASEITASRRPFIDLFSAHARQWVMADDAQPCPKRRERMGRHHPNLHAALQWRLRPTTDIDGPIDDALWIALAMRLTPHAQTPLEATERALDACGRQEDFGQVQDPRLRIRAWRTWAQIARDRGRLQDADAVLDRAVGQAEPVDLSSLLTDAAEIARLRGDLSHARKRLVSASRVANDGPPDGAQELVEARLWLDTAQPNEADRCFAQGIEYAKANGPSPLLASLSSDYGDLLHRRGRLKEAETLMDMALANEHAFQRDRAVGEIHLSLGRLNLDRRRYAPALEHFQLTHHLAARPAWQDTAVHGLALQAMTWLDGGDTERARDRLIAAQGRLRDTAGEPPDSLHRGQLQLGLAQLYVEWLSGGVSRTLGRLDRLLVLSQRVDGPCGRASMLSLGAAALAAAGAYREARRWVARYGAQAQRWDERTRLIIDAVSLFLAHFAPNEEVAMGGALQERTAKLMTRIHHPLPGWDDALWASSLDIRMVQRLLMRQLPENTRRQLVAAAIDPDARGLVVSPDANWIRPPGGEWQDLRRRAVPKRLLQALVRHRSRGDRAMTVTEVVEALWPRETLVGHSGRDRVYQTIRILRRLGLGDVLLHDTDGYRLSPHTPMTWLAHHL